MMMAPASPVESKAAAAANAAPPVDTILWTEVTDLSLEGVGWQADALNTPYDRLPSKAEADVPAAVWCVGSLATEK